MRSETKDKDSKLLGFDSLDKSLPWILFVGGAVVLLASIMLAVEVYNRLKNPAYVPICNLNPVLSCSDVADAPQTHIFGLPNYFLGIASYSVIATVGAAMLAGAKFRRWFWQIMQVGAFFAFGFMTWLQFESLYRIGALCIFCMTLWAGTGPIVWYTTLYNLRHNNVQLPGRHSRLSNFVNRHHGDILLVWFLIIIALILKRFWYYWSGLI